MSPQTLCHWNDKIKWFCQRVLPIGQSPSKKHAMRYSLSFLVWKAWLEFCAKHSLVWCCCRDAVVSKYINPYTDFGFKWLFGTEKIRSSHRFFESAFWRNGDRWRPWILPERTSGGRAWGSLCDLWCILCDEHRRAYHCRDAERASKRVSGSNVVLCGGADSEAGVKGGVEFWA